MSPIELSDIPKLALDFMNRDHREGAELINELNGMIGSASVTDIAGRLAVLATHTRDHFAREEAEMQSHGFPPYPIHRLEHERVLNEMALDLERWNSKHDIESLTIYLRRTLPDWFMRHISTMDKITAEFINQKDEEH